MSGHSKWSNIKHKKEAEDKKRGAIFSRLSKQIIASIREGGGPDPAANSKLRTTVKKARDANMPNSNIERAIKSFSEKAASLEEILLEGYADVGVGVIIETLTDNRNRTLSELKFMFKSHGGALAESGSVLFQFDRLGRIKVEKMDEEKTLDFIEYGVVDIEVRKSGSDRGVVFWVEIGKMEELSLKLKEAGFLILSAEQVYKAKSYVGEFGEERFKRVKELTEELSDHEDVVSVYMNLKK